MLLLGDCNDHLKDIKDNSIDLIVTDPPYGIEFMGKDWDKALVPTETWKECFRVLKEGKLAFIMCSPRQDVLSRMIVNLQDAGFRTNYTSIYWTFASGFPKAANISKLIDKRGGVIYSEEERISFAKYLKLKIKESGLTNLQIREKAGIPLKGGGPISQWTGLTEKSQPKVPPIEIYKKLKIILELGDSYDDFIKEEEIREIIGKGKSHVSAEGQDNSWNSGYKLDYNITKSRTEEAKKMEGAYVGFQPKPAVEIILVVSKGKTLTWLDDCRIPYQSEDDFKGALVGHEIGGFHSWNELKVREGDRKETVLPKSENVPVRELNEKGRFPANLLVSDDVLNDGKITKSSSNLDRFKGVPMLPPSKGWNQNKVTINSSVGGHDEGSYSRYFSLDAWASCSRFPFLIVPKASAVERNKGCESLEKKKGGIAMRQYFSDTIFVRKNEPDKNAIAEYLKEWREKAGLSQSQIDELMGWNTMYSWLEGRKSGVSLTSPESWMKLKEILGFDDKFDKQMTELVEIDRGGFSPSLPRQNTHPTVKPLKLMSYLITMGSREGDLVLDPFCGSGTVCIAAHQLHRKWLGIEMNPEYAEIIKKRLADPLAQLKLTAFA